ncbi:MULTISPECIES: ATP-binding cassette domain-containing protein [unclassified Imperialibacter]|uniref:ATP-binding cassette domain-containing protein n=1 Tax=unclassified Imperialibacter TaxID=2629706 RepID=UPI00125F352E|nr:MULTISPECIES: ATP-binding cassette domain-containing protein [unclassified Imperialibacter]
MSEQLLKAIIHLLAIVAKEDDVTDDERLSILQFLEENISRQDQDKYMNFFDSLTAEMLQKENFDDKAEIISLTEGINKELTQSQKIVVMIDLLEVIVADGEISEREKELVYFIGDRFNIKDPAIDLMKKFVMYTDRSKLDNTNILVADDGMEISPAKSHHITLDGLPGFIAILRIPVIENYFIKYVGKASLHLNGIHLKSNRIQAFSSGSSVRSRISKSLYYSDVVSKFRNETASTKISFQADNVSFKFRNGKLGLQNINIAEDGGKLIGLMGGSGAGKSTLLNVLNSTEKPSEGSVLINGIDVHKDGKKIEGVIGYVPQDDLLIEELSVYQNLFYAGKLCFTDKTDEQIDELVMKTLQSLGLIETRDLKVGSPLQKTISGGQRKRLNIGLELLREPSVLFVDEPTSGLSSRDSENIMDLLKELSLKGKMVFVVIHQPSSEIFKMFDKLVILDVGGYQIYYGNPVDAVIYFKNIVNLVDAERGECVECGNVNPEQIFNIIETKVVNEYGHVTDKRKFQPLDWYSFFKKHITLPKVEPEPSLPEKTLSIPNKLKQIRIFATRDLLSKFSNQQYLAINLLEAPLLAALLAYIVRYYDPAKSYSFYENLNIVAFFFMSVIVALFMGLTVSAEEIIKDSKILKREAFLHLSRMSYLVSKLLILFSFSAIQTLFYVLIGDWILEIDGMTWSYWLVLFSVSCFANVLGLNISSAFNSAITIYIIIPILLIPQLILSGVVVNFDKLNPTFANNTKVPIIGEIMASRWAFEALAVTQYKDNPFTSQFYQFDKDMAQSEYKTVYWAPKLEAALEYCHNVTEKEKYAASLEERFTLLRNELGKELDVIGYDKLPSYERLNIKDFDEATFEASMDFMKAMRKFYNNRYNKAFKEKDETVQSLTKTDEERQEYIALKNEYENESIGQMVKNTAVQERIIEKRGHLIQKIYPIYSRPHPLHPLDFRTGFFVPEKHFLGTYYPTLYFNAAIIWVMSIILITTLYFDIPKKVMKGFSGVPSMRKPKK